LLDVLLGERVLATGDLILAELPQGFATEAAARRAERVLAPLEFFSMAGREVAMRSAANCRRLRRRGVTIRKTMDLSVGTFCAMHGHELLHSDRDFDVLAQYLPLRVVRG
jgi:predicted nucleic acid-binding protein